MISKFRISYSFNPIDPTLPSLNFQFTSTNIIMRVHIHTHVHTHVYTHTDIHTNTHILTEKKSCSWYSNGHTYPAIASHRPYELM